MDFENPPVFWITGPPAAGKSTLTTALLARFEHGLHLPVDDLRLWVVRGLCDSVPWTEETERQFQIAEQAAADVARRYHGAGFAVAIDHCRNLPRLQSVIAAHHSDLPVVKICLLPALEANLDRNHRRTNKPFDPAILDETIRFTSEGYREPAPPGWRVIDNTHLTVEDTVDMILADL